MSPSRYGSLRPDPPPYVPWWAYPAALLFTYYWFSPAIRALLSS